MTGTRRELAQVFAIQSPRAVRKRHPVKRCGEREPLPDHVRLAVIRRDDARCKNCGTWCRYMDIEIDHILPRSAGGSDSTKNLRVLCRYCNQERSNFIDQWGEERRILPATWWCSACAVVRGEGHRPGRLLFGPLVSGLDDVEARHDVCRWCQEGWWGVATPDQTAEPVLAFCAHCDVTSYTTWLL